MSLYSLKSVIKNRSSHFMFKIETENVNVFIVTLVYIFILVTSIIFFEPIKVTVAFIILPIIAIFNYKIESTILIFLTITMITFPVTLQFFGKDAFSTGTIFIFTTLSLSLLRFKLSSTFNKDRILFVLLFFIICIAITGSVTKTPSEFWGPAVRHFVNFLSSIAVFFLIVHLKNTYGIAKNQKKYIENIIKILLIITALHILLSLLLMDFPWIEKYFHIFFDRTKDHLGSPIRDGVYVRATTVFTDGEEFGELLILMFPFALYSFFSCRNMLNLFFTALILFGTLISGTRSTLLLICFQFLVYIYIIVPRIYIKKKIIISIFLMSLVILMSSAFLRYTTILIDRIELTIETIEKHEDFTTILNRNGIWQQAYEVTVDTISLFGHGPIQAVDLGYPVTNFHNLYLSLLFQFGLAGVILFFILSLGLAKRLASNLSKNNETNSNYLLSITCLISFFCFIINEFKFEFNRSDSYQQIVWTIFAVFYLTGRLHQTKINEKIIHR